MTKTIRAHRQAAPQLSFNVLSFVDRNEWTKASALTVRLNGVRQARGKPNISFASVFEGLMYHRLEQAGVSARSLFIQLKDATLQSKLHALCEEVHDACHAEMGKQVYPFLRRAQEAKSYSDVATAGEVCGLLKESDLKLAKSLEAAVNDLRIQNSLPEYNRAEILFGLVAARFIDASNDETGKSFTNLFTEEHRKPLNELFDCLQDGWKVIDAQRRELANMPLLSEGPAKT